MQNSRYPSRCQKVPLKNPMAQKISTSGIINCVFYKLQSEIFLSISTETPVLQWNFHKLILSYGRNNNYIQLNNTKWKI